jgi:hypothetical protein
VPSDFSIAAALIRDSAEPYTGNKKRRPSLITVTLKPLPDVPGEIILAIGTEVATLFPSPK